MEYKENKEKEKEGEGILRSVSFCFPGLLRGVRRQGGGISRNLCDWERGGGRQAEGQKSPKPP